MKIDVKRSLIEAENGGWKLRKLNFMLARGIPYNNPHGIRVQEVTPNRVVSIIPFRRKNLNHVGSIHACGLATVAEFCSGLMLLKFIGSDYRILLQRLEVDYHYQAKAAALAHFSTDQECIDQLVLTPLQSSASVLFKAEVKVRTAAGDSLCTAQVYWHIKAWQQVRTKRT